jgi:hypothetical protein
VVSSGDGAKCVVLCLDKRGVAAKRLRAGCMQSVGRWQLIPSDPLIGSLKQTLFLMQHPIADSADLGVGIREQARGACPEG